jgi:hypothetical protein
VPSNSNVDYGANKLLDRKSVSPERESLLLHETEMDPYDAKGDDDGKVDTESGEWVSSLQQRGRCFPKIDRDSETGTT